MFAVCITIDVDGIYLLFYWTIDPYSRKAYTVRLFSDKFLFSGNELYSTDRKLFDEKTNSRWYDSRIIIVLFSYKLFLPFFPGFAIWLKMKYTQWTKSY